MPYPVPCDIPILLFERIIKKSFLFSKQVQTFKERKAVEMEIKAVEMERNVVEKERKMVETEGKVLKMERKAAKWEILFSNLVLRQGIVGLNNTLAKKVLGNQAKYHFPTLLYVKAHVTKMRNNKYTSKMNRILRQAGWTRKLDNSNMQIKRGFDLNHYVHPNVSTKPFEGEKSIFRKGTPCIHRANHCQAQPLSSQSSKNTKNGESIV